MHDKSKTIPVPHRGHHGGAMTPQAPVDVAPMQEFSMYVVVDAKGNASPATLARSKADVVRRYWGANLRLSAAVHREAARDMKAKGWRIARVAVVEDA